MIQEDVLVSDITKSKYIYVIRYPQIIVYKVKSAQQKEYKQSVKKLEDWRLSR